MATDFFLLLSKGIWIRLALWFTLIVKIWLKWYCVCDFQSQGSRGLAVSVLTLLEHCLPVKRPRLSLLETWPSWQPASTTRLGRKMILDQPVPEISIWLQTSAWSQGTPEVRLSWAQMLSHWVMGNNMVVVLITMVGRITVA